MRIVSGKYKGRRFSPPANLAARPTTDFAKEGLFNVLNNWIDFEAQTALDLFSGTGSISFELVSRGCSAVTSIELNGRHVAFIQKVMRELKIDEMQVIKADVFKFAENCGGKFSFIFADPPYDLPTLEDLPDLVFSNELLKENGLLVLEHSAKQSFEEHPHFVGHRKYGNVNFSLFE